MKKFTLVEVISSILILSIIQAIVMVNFFDIKKKAITNTMSQNISIMQGMVDEYYLKKDKYPILNQNKLSVENPQLIDIDTLLDADIQKKKLDTSKISEQYYWVDAFGKVWGNTENSVETISLIEKGSNDYKLEALVGKNYIGYNVYEVSGYGLSSNLLENLVADSEKLDVMTKSYKLVSEYQMNVSKPTLINYEFRGKGTQYLFSFIDEYGLESAPMGKSFYKNVFKPIIKGEGEYEFEIEGEDTMYWIDFITDFDTPGNSTVDFLFTVKGPNGEYNTEWTTDFFSLDPSKGIKVKVIMKGDDEGNKPSLNDLHIVFKYEEDMPPSILAKEPEVEEAKKPLCPDFGRKSTIDSYASNLSSGQKNEMILGFYVPDYLTIEDTYIPKVNLPNNVKYKLLKTTYFISMDNLSYVEYTNQETSGKCMVVVYEIEVLSFNMPYEDKSDLCGKGGAVTSYNETELQVVYFTYLEKGQFLTKIEKPIVPSKWILTSMFIETSHKGADFKKVSSLSEVKDESCVQIVFKYKGLSGFPPIPPTPSIDICVGQDCAPKKCESNCVNISNPVEKEIGWCDLNPMNPSCLPYCLEVGGKCVPPICTINCATYPPEEPNADDTDLHDPEWTTVNRLKFFGHGAVGQLTHWYRAEHRDSINQDPNEESISLGGNVRIVYRYAKSTGNYWSAEYDDFTETEYASRVMAIAYIQVRTSMKNEISEDKHPTVTGMKFYNEKGVLDLSMVNPTVVILPIKDNNYGREVFSDESNIRWEYQAADARNKKITKVEWGGDIRSKYPVGTYEVKIRVMNEVAYWSDWTVFKFEVLQEKPIAKIDTNPSVFYKNNMVKWIPSNSIDPDGDKIVKIEWSGDKRSSYAEEGEYSVSLRIQDEEGYWSDWTEKKFKIIDSGTKVARIEAEDSLLVKARSFYNDKIKDETSSNGEYITIDGRYNEDSSSLDFELETTGLDIYFKRADRVQLLVDGVLVDQNITGENFLYSFKGLENGIKKISILNGGYLPPMSVDYIDVYSSNFKLSESEVKVTNVSSTNSFINNTPELNYNANNKLRYNYRVDKDGFQSVSIKDKDNITVFSEKSKPIKGGSYGLMEFYWDGLSNAKEQLPTGAYTIIWTFLGIDNKTESTFSKTLKIMNNKPSARIEAEDLTLSVKSSYTTTLSDPSYSDGKASQIKGYYSEDGSSQKFNFKGNSVDIKFINATNFTISIDGKAFDTVTYDSERTYSITNLEDKDHVLELHALTWSRGNAIVDYIDIYSQNAPSIKESSMTILNKSGGVISKGNLLNVNLNEKVRVDYRIDFNSKLNISIKNSQSKEVFTLNKELKGGSKGVHTFDWDGLDNQGDKLPTDTYEATFTLTNQDGVKSSYKFNYSLKNESPMARIEGEDLTLSTKSSYTKTVSNASYSEGVASHIKGYYNEDGSNQVFRFKGSGVDIRFISANNYVIKVDNKIIETVTYREETTYAIRDLLEGEHTLSLIGNTYSNASAIVDYIDIYSNSLYTELTEVSKSIHDEDNKFSKDGNYISTPIQEKFIFTFRLDYNSQVTYTVKNASKDIVFSKTDNLYGGTKGINAFSWDGKDNRAKTVREGSYSVEIKLKNQLNKETTHNLTVFVDNQNYSERIEAEDTSRFTISSAGGIFSDPSLSGGKGLRVQGRYSEDASSLTLKFTGTGFDIRYFKSNNSDITIDGKHISKLTLNDSRTYSVRGLESKEHILVISSGSYVAGRSELDYINIYK